MPVEQLSPHIAAGEEPTCHNGESTHHNRNQAQPKLKKWKKNLSVSKMKEWNKFSRMQHRETERKYGRNIKQHERRGRSHTTTQES